MKYKEPDEARLEAAHKLLNSEPTAGLADLRELASRGSAWAPLYLGWASEHGTGVGASDLDAERWYKLAMDRNLPQASYYLGQLYRRSGRLEESNSAFDRGIALSYSPSIYCKAMNLLDHPGDEKAIAQARNYLEAASELGHVFAMRSLASLLFKGAGGFRAKIRGVLLLVKAIVLGTVLAIRDNEDDRLRA